MLEFPPKLSWSILVSFEFLKEMNCDYFFYVARAEITFPNSSNPRFMLIPYFRVTPVAPVFLSLSEPAKSTKKNFAVIYPWSGYAIICCSICRLKMAWDLEEESFISVTAVVLLMLPLSKRLNICEASFTSYSVTPLRDTLPSFYSLIEIVEFSFILNIIKST